MPLDASRPSQNSLIKSRLLTGKSQLLLIVWEVQRILGFNSSEHLLKTILIYG